MKLLFRNKHINERSELVNYFHCSVFSVYESNISFSVLVNGRVVPLSIYLTHTCPHIILTFHNLYLNLYCV